MALKAHISCGVFFHHCPFSTQDKRWKKNVVLVDKSSYTVAVKHDAIPSCQAVDCCIAQQERFLTDPIRSALFHAFSNRVERPFTTQESTIKKGIQCLFIYGTKEKL
jgi:hypothetical protein